MKLRRNLDLINKFPTKMKLRDDFDRVEFIEEGS